MWVRSSLKYDPTQKSINYPEQLDSRLHSMRLNSASELHLNPWERRCLQEMTVWLNFKPNVIHPVLKGQPPVPRPDLSLLEGFSPRPVGVSVLPVVGSQPLHHHRGTYFMVRWARSFGSKTLWDICFNQNKSSRWGQIRVQPADTFPMM